MSTQLSGNARVVLFSLGLIASPALASSGFAQSPPADAAPASVQAAQAAPAAPSTAWERSVTGSVMWMSSTQSQTAISLQADATGTGTHWIHAIAGEENFVRVSFGGQSSTVSDSQSLRYLARYSKNKDARVYYIVRPSYKRNATQSVDYRFEELFGVGFVAQKSKKFNLDLIPAAGGVQQKKNIEAIDGGHFAGGIYQNASGSIVDKRDPATQQVSQSWSWSQFLLFLREQGSEDYRLQFQGQVQGTIIPHLSLTVMYQFDKENIVLEGNQENDQRVTIGLRIQY